MVKTNPSTHKTYRKRKIFAISLIIFIIFHLWLHITNPYADINVVESPYRTNLDGDSQISLHKNYEMRVYSNRLAQLLGYYKSGFLIIQNTFLPSALTDRKDYQTIIRDIHKLRFDSSKPYLISGNQFSVLYPRNLGVFYNSLLDPRTAHSQKDWQNRQQIYLQSSMFALDAFSSEKKITTTIVPIGQRSTVLTQVHPGSTASDSLYGILYALRALSEPALESREYKIQTIEATNKVVRERQEDLAMLVDIYTKDVQDSQTGLVKRHIKLASARDGVTRDSSFYDNVVLWKTLDLAKELGIKQYDDSYIENLRSAIIAEFWDEQAGIFADEHRDGTVSTTFSADWLIALPTGFLQPANPDDRLKLERIVAYTDGNKIDEPFPIKYTSGNTSEKSPAVVRWFVPNYGGNAIWSYWGAEYITLLRSLHSQTGNSSYLNEAKRHITTYQQQIEKYGGFPETFTAQGEFLKTPFYESILETGWVVQYERARFKIE